MPFVRTSRDKRGYEHIYLIDTPIKRGRPSASRVLYWFRTPPGVKVGREPFDDATRRTLEAQYPGLIFDWKTLANTPMPPPDTEHWRERRRLERAARQARVAEEHEDAAAAAAAVPGPDAGDAAAAVESTDVAPLVDVIDVIDVADGADVMDATEVTAFGVAVSGSDAPVVGQAPDARPLDVRRRRRRGGRRRRPPQGAQGTAGAPSTPSTQSLAPEMTATAGPDRSTLDPHEEE